MKTSRLHNRVFQAISYLEDLKDVGVKFVPTTPSATMMRAGALAGDIEEDKVEKIYRAMIEAENFDEDISSRQADRH